MTPTRLCQKNPNTVPAATASSPCPGRTVLLHCQPSTASAALASGAKAEHCLNTSGWFPPLPLEACRGVVKGSSFRNSLQVGMPKH